jgi:hypothetical protein
MLSAISNQEVDDAEQDAGRGEGMILAGEC